MTIKVNVFHTLHIFLRGGIKDFFDKTSKDFKGMLRMCIFNAGKKVPRKAINSLNQNKICPITWQYMS